MPKLQISSCTVQKLDGEDIIIDIKNLHKGQDLIDEVTKAIGLEECTYFGLRYEHPKDDRVSWFEPNKPLRRQLRKASHHFKFGVQFYPPSISTIKNELTRYQFVLQAREHFLTGYWSSSVPTQALLASYLVQAEFGDYNGCKHNECYLDDFYVMPNQSSELMKKVSNFHKNHVGLSKAEVDWLYLETSQKIALFGMNMFDVWDSDQNMMKFGINSSGIHILHINTVLHTFLWPTVLKCIFKKNNVHIKLQVGEKTLRVGFTTGSEAESKRIATNASLAKYFSVHGKRKVIKYNKKLEAQKKECTHKTDEEDPLEQPFKRVDSKRFSKRFVKVEESLSLDLSSEGESNEDEAHPPIAPAEEVQPVEKQSRTINEDQVEAACDTGDVYLGYPNNILVPTITKTAPSELSLDMDSREDTIIVDGDKSTDEVHAGMNDEDDENVEIIEVVDIEYAGDVSTNEELTSTIVEIRIVSENSKVSESCQVPEENKLDIVTVEENGDVSSRSTQEMEMDFGNDTLDSVTTERKRQSTLLESIERVLNESYEIVIDEEKCRTDDENN